ncbi:MAG: FAD-dependent oxidoreductase, partial [Acetobacteraceae bacterium]
MPQWDFLNFLADHARRFSHFTLLTQAEVTGLLYERNRVAGVSATAPDGPIEVGAKLTVGADGRHSDVRRLAGLAPMNIGAPIDVLWFRVGRDTAAPFEQTLGRVQQGRLIVTLDRGEYWQCAYVIPKGGAEAVRSRGLDAFRADVTQTVPALRAHIDDVTSWDDVKLLTVTVDRLDRWSVPGLLCIGDAAHAMSPVGGVGINLAVQDGVAAANLLAAKLREGEPSADDLDAVRRRRLLPAKIIQALQVTIQNRLLARSIGGGDMRRTFAVMRLFGRLSWLHGLPARLLGFGPRPEHVRTREEPPLSAASI